MKKVKVDKKKILLGAGVVLLCFVFTFKWVWQVSLSYASRQIMNHLFLQNK